jgi:hypothetical protein
MSQSLSSLRWDMTWNSYVVWLCVSVECNLAVVCISVPVLRTLFRRYLPSLFPAGPRENRNGENAVGENGQEDGGKGPRVEKMSNTGATKSSHSRRGDSLEMRGQEAEGPAQLHVEPEKDEAPVNHDQIIARTV